MQTPKEVGCPAEKTSHQAPLSQRRKIKGPHFVVAAVYYSIITIEGVEVAVFINKTSYLPESHRESPMSHAALGLCVPHL